MLISPDFLFPYLQCLTFINLGGQLLPDFSTSHAYAMKSGSLPFLNRVCATSQVTEQEVAQVVNYFGSVPFRWFVPEGDAPQIALLERCNVRYICSFPAMAVELSQMPVTTFQPGLTVQEVETAAAMELWFSVITQSYSMAQPAEFAQCIEELKRRAGPKGLRFYLGFYEEVPVAGSVLMQHGDRAGLHWVGTLPEYRHKGAGLMVSLQPLLDARQQGCATALLFASVLGKHVYERLGFKEYATYKVYGNG